MCIFENSTFLHQNDDSLVLIISLKMAIFSMAQQLLMSQGLLSVELS